MRDIAPSDSEQAGRPFNKMVLPSSHDIGMNSMQTSHALLQQAGTGVIKEILGRSLPNAFEVVNKVSMISLNRGWKRVVFDQIY